MTKAIAVFYTIGLLLALPSRSMCASSPLCELGASVIEQMSLQVNAQGKIDPVALTGSIAFIEECPASVVPAFKRFTSDEVKLRDSWLEALKPRPEALADGELRGFLERAKESVKRNGNAALKEFLDGIFEDSGGTREVQRLPESRLFEQQSLATLRHFRRCDAAECYKVSDFLLFLLGSHPAAFFAGYARRRARCDEVAFPARRPLLCRGIIR